MPVSIFGLTKIRKDLRKSKPTSGSSEGPSTVTAHFRKSTAIVESPGLLPATIESPGRMSYVWTTFDKGFYESRHCRLSLGILVKNTGKYAIIATFIFCTDRTAYRTRHTLSILSRVSTAIKPQRSNGSRKIIERGCRARSENDWSWRTTRWALLGIHLYSHLWHDEMCYSADDLLPVCEELNIPLVVSAPPTRAP